MSEKSPQVASEPVTVADSGANIEDALNQESGVSDDRPSVSAKYIWFLILANLGGFVALVAPIGYSLAVRVQQLAPQHTEELGYVIGAGAVVAVVASPLTGLWSDRTRSRFGRRRPFALVGALVGLIGLAFIAFAPSVPLVAVGWMITELGFTPAMNSLILSQADRLPERQRGRVSGLTGMVQMIAAVLGTGIAAAFVSNNFLMFLVPGLFGMIFILLWVFVIREQSTADEPKPPKLTAGKVLVSLVFNPARYTNFGWNWLGRFVFMLGVTFATTFTTLFFASRLAPDGKAASIGGLVVILSLLGVVATAGGALAGGFLSDKLQRRRMFVLVAGIGYTIGAILMAFGGSNATVLITGSIVASLGLGVFSAVDQAIVLDVLPKGEEGRFVGINVYSVSLAQAIAPIIAAPLLLIGVTGSDKNYGLILLIAAACTLVGGNLVGIFVKSK